MKIVDTLKAYIRFNIRNSFHYFYFLIRSFQHTSNSNFNIPQSWLWNLDREILTLCLLVMDFNQPFNKCNIGNGNHKNGNIVSYQLLFTKPKTSNVFYHHCCRVVSIVQHNQFHVSCIELKIKWQCLCIIIAQPIYNH